MLERPWKNGRIQQPSEPISKLNLRQNFGAVDKLEPQPGGTLTRTSAG